MADQVTGRYGRRLDTIQDRPHRSRYMNRAKRPFVVRHERTDGSFNRERGIRVRIVQYHVDATSTLRRRSCEVDENVLVFHGYGHANTNWLFEAVAPRFVFIATIRDLANRGSQRFFGARDNLVRERVSRSEVELIHQLQQAACAHRIRRRLSVQIADSLLRCAYVRSNNLDKVSLRRTTIEELHDRNTQTLFEHFVCLGRKNAAADIRSMTRIGEITHDLLSLEDRRQ